MRKLWPTPGGIHPATHKQQSNQQPICSAGMPDELIFPLAQYHGAAAEPCVTIKQTVYKGEIIAHAKEQSDLPIHVSSSGTVTAIEQRPLAHPSGLNVPCVIIKPDGKDQWLEHQGIADYRTVDKALLIQRLRQAGIHGMGGAGFPSAIKLTLRPKQVVDTLIINGAECEPYITADDRLMRERPAAIIQGVQVLQYLLNPTDATLIGVEDDKPEAIAALRQAAQGTSIEVVAIPTKYPSGGEKQLIQQLTGREVPSFGLPIDIGVICQNVATTAAIYRAIVHGEPVTSRIVTVTGDGCTQAGNREVLLGTPIDWLLKRCGVRIDDCDRLIVGGPMMGFTLPHLSAPVAITTNCLLAAREESLPHPPPAQACIRCGLCAEACPASLLPQQLYWFARGKDYEQLEEHQLFDCIECGACTYVCPSAIPLVHYYRASKQTIRQQKQAHHQAEHAKMRFETRQTRLEQEAETKRARREARRQAIQHDSKQKDAVQDAIKRVQNKRQATVNQPTPDKGSPKGRL